MTNTLHTTRPHAPRRLRRLGLTAGATAVAALALAASGAEAKVYCVNMAACPAGGIVKPNLNAALEDKGASPGADADPDADEIRIGPGTYAIGEYPNGYVSADTNVRIIGSGMGKTTLVPNYEYAPGMRLIGAGSSVEDLSLRLEHKVSGGISLIDGADATRVKIYSTGDNFSTAGFHATHDGTVLDHVQTDLCATCLAVEMEDGLVTDSTITGGMGIRLSSDHATVRRTTIHASHGIATYHGKVDARNVVITPHPRDPSAFKEALFVSGNLNETDPDTELNASHLTLVGNGYGSGIRVFAPPSMKAGQTNAFANVSDSIVRGFAHSVKLEGATKANGAGTANASLSSSVFDPTTVSQEGPGTFKAPTSDNFTTNADPKFVDAAGLDFRPRYNSLLIDAGHAGADGPDAEGDLNGNPRVRDGNGNGSATRDIGAYEYQRQAPVAAFGFGSPGPFVNEPTAFADASTDIDGDALTYAWTFGDGATASAANPTHTYAATGSYTAALKVTDPTGLSASASKAVGVAARPATLPGGGAGSGGAGSSRGVAGSGQARDTTRPELSALRLSKPRLRLRSKAGSRVSFTLSEPSRVALTVQRKLAGRLTGKRCGPATKATAKKKACTRWVPVRGSIELKGTKGANAFAFSARPGGKRLHPGTYRLTAIARDVAGNTSAPRLTQFAVAP